MEESVQPPQEGVQASAADLQETVALILGHERFLRCLASRLAEQVVDAEDLVQETMLRAFCARDRFQRGTNMRAWLSTILRRLFLTQKYTEKRRGMSCDTDLGGPLVGVLGELATTRSEEVPDLEKVLEHFDDDFRRAVLGVPAVHLASFTLSVFHGLAYSEIGARLGIPVGTVMSRIHRAREWIKAELSRRRVTARQPLRLVRKPLYIPDLPRSRKAPAKAKPLPEVVVPDEVQVAQGEPPAPKPVARTVPKRPRRRQPKRKERLSPVALDSRIFQQRILGSSDAEIAKGLGVSVVTVQRRLKCIAERLRSGSS